MVALEEHRRPGVTVKIQRLVLDLAVRLGRIRWQFWASVLCRMEFVIASISKVCLESVT